MKIIKLLTAIFAVYYVTLFSNAYAQELCEECLENVPADMRDYVNYLNGKVNMLNEVTLDISKFRVKTSCIWI